MISHRGISVITPLPFGEGKGEGPAGEGGGASWGRGRGQLGKGEGPPLVGILTMQTGNVKIFHRLVPFYYREKAEYATRRGFSAYENMLFLPQEGRFLRARRAYT